MNSKIHTTLNYLNLSEFLTYSDLKQKVQLGYSQNEYYYHEYCYLQ